MIIFYEIKPNGVENRTVTNNKHFFFKHFSCKCTTGYSGKNCTLNLDDCKSHSCLNGGRCVDGLGDYTCYCPRGFSGRFCEIAPMAVNTQFSYNSLCQSHACQNNGVCYVPKGGSHYMCQCAPGTNFGHPFLFSFIYTYISLLFLFALLLHYFISACFPIQLLMYFQSMKKYRIIHYT